MIETREYLYQIVLTLLKSFLCPLPHRQFFIYFLKIETGHQMQIFFCQRLRKRNNLPQRSFYFKLSVSSLLFHALSFIHFNHKNKKIKFKIKGKLKIIYLIFCITTSKLCPKFFVVYWTQFFLNLTSIFYFYFNLRILIVEKYIFYLNKIFF